MKERTKFYSILILFIIFSFFCFLFFTKNPDTAVNLNYSLDDKTKETQKVDLAKLESDYRQNVKLIFSEFVNSLQQNSLSIMAIKEEKNRLLGLKVTDQYKDLHINLVLAMVKIEKFIAGGNMADKKASEELVKKIKNNYSWIN